MGKQQKIFDLLTKKQSLNVYRSKRKKNKLSEQLTEIYAYRKQLLEILDSISSPQKNKTVAEIKSETWYKLKIQDELIGANNKIDFLSLELKNQNIQVALEAEKHKKFEEKKNYFKRLEIIDREKKLDLNSPSQSGNRVKF